LEFYVNSDKLYPSIC